MDRFLDVLKTIHALNGSPEYLGTISASSGAAVNSFTIPAGTLLMLQPTAAGYVLPGSANTVTVTALNGVKLDADEKFPLFLRTPEAFLAWLPVSGAADLKVWRLH